MRQEKAGLIKRDILFYVSDYLDRQIWYDIRTKIVIKSLNQRIVFSGYKKSLYIDRRLC